MDLLSFFFRRKHCDTPLGLLQLVYLHCSMWPPLLTQHFRPTLAFKPLIPLPPTFHFLPSAFSSLPHAPGCFSLPPASSSSLDFFRVFQWNAGGLRARSTELLRFISSHSVDFICIQESNLNLSFSFRIPGFSAL